MATHKNFYETINEANIRLRGTIILYDKEPYYVHTITNHKGDSIFRVYMTDIARVKEVPANPVSTQSIPHGHAGMGTAMDSWMGQNPDFILRKQMNSPLFNKFRPFPLGMFNSNGVAVYISRQPARPKTEQGLTSSMLYNTRVSVGGSMSTPGIDMFTGKFRDCVLGNYPSPVETLNKLKDPKCANEAVGFHREFALARGPINMLFLAYREDIIGVLPAGDFNKVILGKDFEHCKETVSELNLFANVVSQ